MVRKANLFFDNYFDVREDTPPASAMFASFSRYKREAFRHSVFAPRILHDAGLRVVMKVGEL